MNEIMPSGVAASTAPAAAPLARATLAIHGGERVRKTPMPARLALGDGERQMIQSVLDYYRERNLDPGYEGHFEKMYCRAFVEMMGGGYADAVATGTSSLYIAVAALNLPKGSEVLVSPITDPGSLAAIVLNGLKPRLIDSKPGSYNVGPEQFAERITPNVTGAMIVHAAGQAAEIDKIVEIAHAHGIKVVEDCAQAHGALLRAKRVGTFGDIAAFSTMYRKAHMTGPSGRRGLHPRPRAVIVSRSRMPTAASRAGAMTSATAIRPPICSRRSITTPMRSRARSGWRRLRGCAAPLSAGSPSSLISSRG